jgi:hypothetical protein
VARTFNFVKLGFNEPNFTVCHIDRNRKHMFSADAGLYFPTSSEEILTLIEPTADVLFLIKPKINIKAFESCEEN